MANGEAQSPPELWLPVAIVRDSLDLAGGGPDDDAQIKRCRDAAIRLVERITRRPLTGRTARYVVPAPPSPETPVVLTALRDSVAVQDVGWWDSTGPAESAATPLVTGQDRAPDVGRLERLDEGGEWWDEPLDYRLWPRAAGWPAEARRLEVRLRLSMVPTAHEDLRQACIRLAGMYYDGRSMLTADELRGLQTVLPGVVRWVDQSAS